jgi:hypothetical protein
MAGLVQLAPVPIALVTITTIAGKLLRFDGKRRIAVRLPAQVE